MLSSDQQTVAVAEAISSGQQSYRSAWWNGGISSVVTKWGAIIEASRGWLPLRLVAARIWFESRGNPKAVSGDPVLAEKGLLQLSVNSVEQYRVADPFNPNVNVEVGCRLWRAWAESYFRWAKAELGVSLAPESSLTETWLVTAIGPGAVRELAKASGSPWASGWLEWARKNPAQYYALHSKGVLGRAAAEKTLQRVSLAVDVVGIVERKEGGFMTLKNVVLVAAVAGLAAVAAFYFIPQS